MIKIEILFDETNGQIKISGPIKNKVLTLGILENAKYAVMSQDFNPKIEVPDFPPNFKL